MKQLTLIVIKCEVVPLSEMGVSSGHLDISHIAAILKGSKGIEHPEIKTQRDNFIRKDTAHQDTRSNNKD
jgi:hypothetical protein